MVLLKAWVCETNPDMTGGLHFYWFEVTVIGSSPNSNGLVLVKHRPYGYNPKTGQHESLLGNDWKCRQFMRTYLLRRPHTLYWKPVRNSAATASKLRLNPQNIEVMVDGVGFMSIMDDMLTKTFQYPDEEE